VQRRNIQVSLATRRPICGAYRNRSSSVDLRISQQPFLFPAPPVAPLRLGAAFAGSEGGFTSSTQCSGISWAASRSRNRRSNSAASAQQSRGTTEATGTLDPSESATPTPTAWATRSRPASTYSTSSGETF
jgi:hypothetical protein